MEIRKALIHWLGGVTQKESEESNENSWILGRASMCIYLVEFMKQMNGVPADMWARKVWLETNEELALCTKDNALLEKVKKGEV